MAGGAASIILIAAASESGRDHRNAECRQDAGARNAEAHPAATRIAADDRKRGMAMFRSEQPDLVVIDIVIPEQEGIRTIAEITEGAALDAKIIAFSGSGRIGDADFLNMGDLSARWTSSRSPSMRTLLTIVENCLAGRAVGGDAEQAA
jgi:DNA-binding NarL/FixJ family response regulator